MHVIKVKHHVDTFFKSSLDEKNHSESEIHKMLTFYDFSVLAPFFKTEPILIEGLR